MYVSVSVCTIDEILQNANNSRGLDHCVTAEALEQLVQYLVPHSNESRSTERKW